MQTFAKDDKIENMNNGKVNEFADWLQNQLDKRNWTAQDLAKKSGLGNSTITRILTGVRGAGKDACTKIAQVLKEDPEKIFRLAGILPEGEKRAPRELSLKEWSLLEFYRQLPDDQKEFILETVKGLAARHAAKKR